MADWTDNALKRNSWTSPDWVQNGQATDSIRQENNLISVINNRSSDIHRIDEDIDRYEQAIQDIDHAIEGYTNAVNDMKMLEAEVALVFKGESAEAFIRKITSYKSYCLRRKEHMKSLKKDYKQQISDLKRQKELAQHLLNSLRERLDKLRKSRICMK